MKNSAIVLAIAVIAVAAACFAVFVQPPADLNCAKDDSGCIKDVQTRKMDCIPSTSIVHGRDGIVLMVNITIEGGKCVRKEEIIGSESQNNSYLIGRNASCEYEISQMHNSSATVCPGSFYEYVVPSAEGGGVPLQPQQEGGKITCGIDDVECKDIAIGYFDSCVTSEIVNSELKWPDRGYWTLLIKITRNSQACNYYYQVLNAVNLPGGIPQSIIGSTMVCDVPLSSIPIENPTAEWCSGDFYHYLYP